MLRNLGKVGNPALCVSLTVLFFGNKMVIVPREVAEVPPSVNQLAKMTSSPQITFPARKGDGIMEKDEDGGLVTAPRFY